jgi:hypothetical protein
MQDWPGLLSGLFLEATTLIKRGYARSRHALVSSAYRLIALCLPTKTYAPEQPIDKRFRHLQFAAQIGSS